MELYAEIKKKYETKYEAVHLVCRYVGNMYRWYDDLGNFTGISGTTLEKAKETCMDVWGVPAWEIRQITAREHRNYMDNYAILMRNPDLYNDGLIHVNPRTTEVA